MARRLEELRYLITEATTITLEPEDVTLVDQQKDALKDIISALDKLKGNTSKLGGLDVRDAVKSLKTAKIRIEKNLSFVDRVFSGGKNTRAA